MLIAVLADDIDAEHAARIKSALDPPYRVLVADELHKFERLLVGAGVGVVIGDGKQGATPRGAAGAGPPLLLVNPTRRRDPGIQDSPRDGWEARLPALEIEFSLLDVVTRALVRDLRQRLWHSVLNTRARRCHPKLLKAFSHALNRKLLPTVHGLAKAGGWKNRRSVEEAWRNALGPAAPKLKTYLIAIALVDVLLQWLEDPTWPIVAAGVALGVKDSTTRGYLRYFADVRPGSFHVGDVAEIIRGIEQEVLNPFVNS